jgi:hypothetical protein
MLGLTVHKNSVLLKKDSAMLYHPIFFPEGIEEDESHDSVHENSESEEDRFERFRDCFELMTSEEKKACLRFMEYCAFRSDKDTHIHTQAELNALFKAAKQLH